MADITVDEAVKRNCEALVAGNYAQIFADMTPQAMAKLSQTMAAAGPQLGGQMPKLERYDIVSHDAGGEEHLYDVRFTGDMSFGVRGRWQEINGVWKLVDFEAYQLETEPPAPA